MNLINELNKGKNVDAFNAKKSAVNAWKESNFSLFGIINYVSKNVLTSKDLKDSLECVPGLSSCKNQSEVKELLTIDYIKECLGERGLNTWTLNPETGKRDIKGELKTKFSLWTVLTAIQKANK